ncbi:MAG: Lacal_2735 family protein [Cyclobacteriaceae bacterium]
MFGLFKKKSEEEKLEERYRKLLEEARDIQRGGDMKAFAIKSAEAEEVAKRLEEVRAKK